MRGITDYFKNENNIIEIKRETMLLHYFEVLAFSVPRPRQNTRAFIIAM